MKANLFGASQRQLYGAYHPPRDEHDARSTAVVLAYPWMAEYNMHHWAYRKLAVMLARDGFPTFRFDYYGTGDSMGEASDARYAGWVQDLVTACREARDLSGSANVSIVGTGIGAALAVAASKSIAVRDLVFWKPVVRGADYLRELAANDAAQRLQRLYPEVGASAARDELLGFVLPAEARAQLSAIDMLTTVPTLEGRVTIVVGETRDDYGALHALYAKEKLAVQLTKVEDKDANGSVAGGDSALLAAEPLRAIAAALVEGEPA